jgi:magnesium transporter
MHVIAYGPDRIIEQDIHDPAEISALVAQWPVVWLNLDGLADIKIIQALGEVMGLHSLALEDVVNVHQRPKVEDYDDHTFIVLRIPHAGTGLQTEQISLFLGDRFVVTFQERPGDCFDPVRDRIRKQSGRVRNAGADYLAYTLIDAAIDSFFPILESYGEHVEELESAVLREPAPGLVSALHDVKRDLLTLRRAIWPQREMVNTLIRDDAAFFAESTRVYLRDCYDHCIQLMDMVETYREIASGLVDLYLTTVSNRTNDIMKVLTIIATIFIPLSFVASLYGMNFDPESSPWNMPELDWRFGYPMVLALMLAVALGLVGYFVRRGWIGRRSRPHTPKPWRGLAGGKGKAK